MTGNKENLYIELIDKARAGNEMAFRELLLNISYVIRYYLAYYIIIPELRECILQDILIAIQESLHTYDRDDKFPEWLFYVMKYRVEISLKYYNLSYNRGFRYKKFLKCYELPEDVISSKFVEEVDLDFLSARDKKLLEIFEEKEFNLTSTAKELHISKARLKYRIGSIFRIYRRKVKGALK